MVIALLSTLIAPDLKKRVQLAWQHPVVLGSLFWWGLLALSALHAPQSVHLWRSWLGLITFSYPLIIISLIGTDHHWRRRAAWAFGLSVGTIVVISWGQFAGVLPQRHLIDGAGLMRNVVFKDHTQQGLATLSLASLLFALAVWQRGQPVSRYLWCGVVVCVLSVLFALESRTALLSMMPLGVLWIVLVFLKGSWGKKLALVIFFATSLALTLSWLQANKNESRLTQVNQEIQVHTEHKTASSTGIRIELWRQSVIMIKQTPLLGRGFDQWHATFLAQTRDIPAYEPYRMRFPHQEFLLIMAEQGLIGFAVYAALLFGLAMYIKQLALPYRHFYAALLLLYLTAGMANSLIADFTGRHLWLVCLSFMPWASMMVPRARNVVSTAL